MMKRWIVQTGPNDEDFEIHTADKVVIDSGTLAMYKTHLKQWENGRRVAEDPDLLIAWAAGQWLTIVPDR